MLRNLFTSFVRMNHYWLLSLVFSLRNCVVRLLLSRCEKGFRKSILNLLLASLSPAHRHSSLLHLQFPLLDRCCQWKRCSFHWCREFWQYPLDVKWFRSHSWWVDGWDWSNWYRCAWCWWSFPSVVAYSECPRHFEWSPMRSVRCQSTLDPIHLFAQAAECCPNRNDCHSTSHRRTSDRRVHVCVGKQKKCMGQKNEAIDFLGYSRTYE